MALQAIPSGSSSKLAKQMEQPTLTPAKCFVRDLADGQEVDAIFVVRARAHRQKRNGEAFLKLQLGDVTGVVEALVWDGVEELAGVCDAGAIVRVLGRYSVDERYGGTITIRRMRPAAEGEYQLVDLTESAPIPYRQMAADLTSLVETVQRQHLRQLLDRLIDRDYHEAPAAKYYHQAYRHGLLEHCLSVAQGVSALAATFPGIDRDIAVAGALLHDIGKVETYACRNGAIELTDAGKLLGEIPLGYYRVRRAIEEIEAFPATDADSLLHIILSHHGKLEHGSPVVPCTREATLVHFIDNLGGNLGSFDRIEKALAEGAAWSDFDRGIATAAYFGAREQAA
jgi:3'-5' exoribonuclease